MALSAKSLNIEVITTPVATYLERSMKYLPRFSIHVPLSLDGFAGCNASQLRTRLRFIVFSAFCHSFADLFLSAAKIRVFAESGKFFLFFIKTRGAGLLGLRPWGERVSWRFFFFGFWRLFEGAHLFILGGQLRKIIFPVRKKPFF